MHFRRCQSHASADIRPSRPQPQQPGFESAVGFAQSFPGRRVSVCGLMFGCFNLHVQTCSSFIACREDSLNLPMSFPTCPTPPRNHVWFVTVCFKPNPGWAHLLLVIPMQMRQQKNTGLEGKIHLSLSQERERVHVRSAERNGSIRDSSSASWLFRV